MIGDSGNEWRKIESEMKVMNKNRDNEFFELEIFF